ncbi:hypothetical protein N752_03215 [Desulforamulus aquiferis]|nr:hypothetical protein N752_03215 [Desulforamulus aquiferis]
MLPIIRMLFLDYKFWFRQFSVNLVVLIISVPILIIPFYRGIEAYVWHKLQPANVIAEIKPEDMPFYGNKIEELTLFKMIGTLANNPPLILADEPTGNLDGDNVQSVLNILRDLNREGKTIILATHDDRLIQNSSRVIRLGAGISLSPC